MIAMTVTNNPTKTALAAEGTQLMTKFKHSAALLLCLAGLGSGAVSAQSLILKSNTGSTLVQYPLATSASCVLTGTGDIEVKPQPAAGTSGDGWCPQGAAPTPPTFPAALTVTPTTITTGNTVSASWTSSGAQSCTGAATRNGNATTVSGWNGTQPLTFTNLQLTPPTAGAYIFTITCTNTAGPTPSSSATINVTEPGTGACAGVTPTFPNLTRQNTFVNTAELQQTGNGNSELLIGPIDVTIYAPFMGPEFPRVRADTGLLPVKRDQYVAMAFNTGTVTTVRYGAGPPNPNRFGTIEWVPPNQFGAEILVALTECPGDFSNLPVAVGDNNGNAECRASGTESRLEWGVDPTLGNNFVCRLKENTTYYVNVAFVNFSTGNLLCNAPETSGSNIGACRWLRLLR